MESARTAPARYWRFFRPRGLGRRPWWEKWWRERAWLSAEAWPFAEERGKNEGKTKGKRGKARRESDEEKAGRGLAQPKMKKVKGKWKVCLPQALNP